MDQINYWVIIIFTLIVVGAGLSFGKRGGDMKSFFAAGGAVPWSISGLSLFMSFFSAGTFVVWGSIAYQYGWVAITIQWTMCISGFLVGRFIAPRWRQTFALTAAEYIHKRLGITVQQIYMYIFLFLTLGYTGAFLYPVAKLVNVSTGFSIEYSIIFLGSLIILYTAVGGLWAVVVTDVLQFVILTAAVLIVVPLAIERVQGLGSFVDQSPEGFFSFFSGEYSLWFIIAFTFYNTVFIGGNWAYVQRYTSVKNRESASKVGYLFGALYVVSPVIWMLPPMLYRAVDPNLSGLENEGAYLLMCREVLPAGMLGLMLGGMIFATASSVNTSLNLSAAVLTNDIYKQFNPKASGKKLMLAARFFTLLFGIGTILVALMVPMAGGIVEVVLSIGAVTGVSLYGPPIWSLFSKRHTGKSILWITIISLGINIFFKLIAPWTINISLNRAQEMSMGVFVPLILLSLYEVYAFRKQNTSRQYVLYERNQEMEGRVREEDKPVDQTGPNQNLYGIRVIGISLVLIALLMLGIGFIAKEGVALVIIMSVLVISVGISLWNYSRKASKTNYKVKV
jgi:solute:Na+ symporter, SSS family